MPRQTKTVSDKNTKQDILAAYQELLADAEGQPVTQSTLSAIERNDKELLANISDSTASLHSLIDSTLGELRSKFEVSENVLSNLHKLQESSKKTLSEKQQEELKEQTRQKEEFTYEFSRMKKRAEEELSEQKSKTEAELSQKRQQLKDQEDEFIDLKNQAKTFEPRMQKAVNDAVVQALKDQKISFDHERALLTQEAKMTQSLLEQKIGLLETAIATQKTEITRLAASADAASSQMTRIAERAVTKTPDQPIPLQKTS